MSAQNIADLQAAQAAPFTSEAKHPMPKADLQRLLVDWNNTAKAYPADKCIHELVEIRAAQTPRAPAAESGSRTLTYAELNLRANQLEIFFAARVSVRMFRLPFV